MANAFIASKGDEYCKHTNHIKSKHQGDEAIKRSEHSSMQ